MKPELAGTCITLLQAEFWGGYSTKPEQLFVLHHSSDLKRWSVLIAPEIHIHGSLTRVLKVEQRAGLIINFHFLIL